MQPKKLSRLEKLKKYRASKEAQKLQEKEFINSEAKHGCGPNDPTEGEKI